MLLLGKSVVLKMIFIGSSFVTFIYLFVLSISRKEAKERQFHRFKLEHCDCERVITIQDTKKVISYSLDYTTTTCGRDAYRRGLHQKVAGFSFFGNRNSSIHQTKRYFEGIADNLKQLPQFYNDSWTMRLYYDLEDHHPLLKHLCDLACSNTHLDLCHVQKLPGTPVTNASSIFPRDWRFFPTLDPQVDVFLSRDLDSRINDREVAAVQEWLESDKVVHIMRDNPAHFTEILGGGWGAKMDQTEIRQTWKKSWEKILKDKLAFANRSEKIPDQSILKKYVWPWAKEMAMQHDSYL